jgi:hypothetical protein
MAAIGPQMPSLCQRPDLHRFVTASGRKI